ncbi:hypothetical protein LV780_03780 [Cereibacter azotoformans]|uniref:Uncharacterized protein n=1 Tax=Cereibacter azotoformans TaxID=43057 RepID=A0A2T5JWQ3_9RHOB|nr:hypothetical protein [Cereibacter azotoformans]AXQ93007.1 hypothetical protein D0Z66_03770 [Cereibacter sphaeroides]MBO4169304.1 hypothetical protein [Cereibacter azotoformans]PTR14596.1 hypothetical protein C8J28_11668 [Cereibacter azotoformans]UIJ31308.1 hypothetical protein LV780_03780 [Cereibacter azotoformans]
MSGEVQIMLGMTERLLPAFNPEAFAQMLTPILDRSDSGTAVAVWSAWKTRAERQLIQRKVPEATRRLILRDLTAAVRLELYEIRGSVKCGPRPAQVASSAQVLSFRPRAAAGGGDRG